MSQFIREESVNFSMNARIAGIWGTRPIVIEKRNVPTHLMHKGSKRDSRQTLRAKCFATSKLESKFSLCRTARTCPREMVMPFVIDPWSSISRTATTLVHSTCPPPSASSSSSKTRSQQPWSHHAISSSTQSLTALVRSAMLSCCWAAT